MKLQWIVLVTICLTLSVIVLGAYTRLSDAGLGCPDWPGCYGQLTVPTSATQLASANSLYPELEVVASKAWPEMIHRYVAGTLGLLVFFVSYLSIKKTPWRVVPILMSVVVVAQALLGMWTVTLKLMPIVVMAHLVGGFTLLCLLVLYFCQLKRSEREQQKRDEELPAFQSAAQHSNVRLQWMGWISFAVVIGQIMLGGWTSSNYAALMCTTLPICQGDWVSYLDFNNAFTLIQRGFDNYEFGVLEYPARMTIHVSHRFGAILTMLVLGSFILMLFRASQRPVLTNRKSGGYRDTSSYRDTSNSRDSSSYRMSSNHRTLAWSLLFFLVVQVLLGIGNVVMQLPLINAVLHNLVAALLLSNLVVANYFLYVATPHRYAQKIKNLPKKKQEAFNE